jgi:hypothetical protein
VSRLPEAPLIELRIIAVEGDALLLGGATSTEARYRVAVTDAVADAIAEARSGTSATRALSRSPSLTPAQVQARLRAGAAIAEVAREAGTDIAWVQRWSHPVEAERAQVIRGTRGAHVTLDTGVTDRSLDQLIRAWLPSNVDPSHVEWTTARRRDGRWRVTMRVAVGSKHVTGTWLWDPRAQRVTPASARARAICAAA